MEGYDHDDGLEAISWLNGTEPGKILQRKDQNGGTTLVSYTCILLKEIQIYTMSIRKKSIVSFMI